MTLDELFNLALPLIVVGALLAAIGQAITKAIGKSREGWRGLWYRTRTLHPILAGLALGFTSLPVPEVMGTSLAGHLAWYGLGGALAVPFYAIVRKTIERKFPTK